MTLEEFFGWLIVGTTVGLVIEAVRYTAPRALQEIIRWYWKRERDAAVKHGIPANVDEGIKAPEYMISINLTAPLKPIWFWDTILTYRKQNLQRIRRIEKWAEERKKEEDGSDKPDQVQKPD